MIVTISESPSNTKSTDMDRTHLNLRSMFHSIHRLGDCVISGTTIEDVTTFTSTGEYGPEQLVDQYIEKYGPGDVFDECRPGELPRRITVMRVDEDDRNRNDIPRDIYSGSEIVYVIKPDRDRLSTQYEKRCQALFGAY